MYAQAEKTKENKSRAVANSVSQKKGNGKQGFGFVDNRKKSVTQQKILDNRENKIWTFNRGQANQLVREITETSEDTSGVCGYMALHVAFKALKSDYNEGKRWADFKEAAIQKNAHTAICTIEVLMGIIRHYDFIGQAHAFESGAGLVTALEGTGTNPVLIGHTLLGIPERGVTSGRAGDAAHWSVISDRKGSLITLWDNWVEKTGEVPEGGDKLDYPYEIEAEALSASSQALVGERHSYKMKGEGRSELPYFGEEDLDIGGQIVELRLP